MRLDGTWPLPYKTLHLCIEEGENFHFVTAESMAWVEIDEGSIDQPSINSFELANKFIRVTLHDQVLVPDRLMSF